MGIIRHNRHAKNALTIRHGHTFSTLRDVREYTVQGIEIAMLLRLTSVMIGFRPNEIHVRSSGEYADAHLSLQPALEHLLGGELKHEVEFLLVLSEETEPSHTAEKGGAFKQALRVLLFEGQELTGSLFVSGDTTNERTRRGGDRAGKKQLVSHNERRRR